MVDHVPPRILIVEPNGAALAVTARRIAAMGYKVVACDRPGQAVAEMLRQPVQLVIAEARMAGTSGLDLARIIRAESTLADMGLMLVVGRSDRDGAILGFAAGADDVIVKPYEFDVLGARIARLLDRARHLRSLRDDMVAMDARVTHRAIEVGELKVRLAAYEGRDAR